MATTVYKTSSVKTVQGTRISLSPLKLKYLHEFMEIFEMIKEASDDDEAMTILTQCVAISMQQYNPSLASQAAVEDSFDVKAIYKVLEAAADIKMSEKNPEVKKQAKEGGSSWFELDLAKLESEAFLLGIWKDYEELETSMSMPELLATLDAKRDQDYSDKKFFAAIQGIDLDKQSGKQNAWEEMKARVFSGNGNANPNDVTSLQGYNAQKAGFGIGMGLSYTDLTKK
jgi:hypothetical protein